MGARHNTTESLEDVLKVIIDDWYAHIEEYPELHKYLAASLAEYGIPGSFQQAPLRRRSLKCL